VRLGVIADIHADVVALDTALSLLVKRDVDKIVCLGDVVEKGHHADACVQRLQTWLIPCVLGNHDELATSNQAFADDDPRWRSLSDETLGYLRGLPKTKYYVYEGICILLCHGSPTNVWEYLHPGMAPDKRFKQIASKANADVILRGQTHIPMHETFAGVHFLKPGSVCGTHSSGSRTCGILHLPECQFEILDLPE
jgi:protein phosphatase